jgi:CRISPR-associated DxTHG motif protein
MLKLFSFAGTGHYQQATYEWGERSLATPFICQALSSWLEPEEIFVVMTPTAERHENWRSLQSAVPGVRALRIPEPGSESALWEIFRTLSEAITPHDEIIIDVTHAFRALPLIALASASYVQTLTGAKIRHILYGAWEARDQDSGRCPVYDLGLFLRLQEWTLAAAILKQTGDSRLFGRLLSDIQNDFQSRRSEAENGALPTRLKSAGAALDSLSKALALTRPDEIALALPELFRRLDQASGQFDRWAAPFSQALTVIKETYSPLAGGTLASEFCLIQWYAEREHPLQAVTLAREWIVSCTAAHLGFAGQRHRSDREPVENMLNHATIRRAEEIRGIPSPLLPAFDALPCAEVLERTWGRVRDLRNDLAHCGMNERPASAASALKGVRNLLNLMKEIPLPLTSSAETGE